VARVISRARVAWVGAALLLTLACRRDGGASAAQGPYADEVRTAVPQIERATGLKFKRPPVLQRHTKAEVREFLVKQFSDSRSQADLAGQQVVLRLLGLIPDTMDLRAFLVDLYTEQVVGFYDPTTKVLYVVDGTPKDQVDVVVQHELVHALQDQYINLDSIQHIQGHDDRVLAAQAVIEGQAVLVPLQVMLGPAADFPGGWDRVRDMIRENRGSMPKFAAAPEILQELAIFPYLNGAEYVRRFLRAHPGQQPYGANLPLSTEEILHDTATPPVTISLPAPAGGKNTYENEMGEFTTRLFLFQHLNDQRTAVRAAAGWNGDRYMVIHTAAGDGMAWATVWATNVDAAEFGTALGDVMAKRFPNVHATSTPTGKRWALTGRTVTMDGGEVDGHPTVLYLDMPNGSRPPFGLKDLKIGAGAR
jgi:hypothetical protein